MTFEEIGTIVQNICDQLQFPTVYPHERLVKSSVASFCLTGTLSNFDQAPSIGIVAVGELSQVLNITPFHLQPSGVELLFGLGESVLNYLQSSFHTGQADLSPIFVFINALVELLGSESFPLGMDLYSAVLEHVILPPFIMTDVLRLGKTPYIKVHRLTNYLIVWAGFSVPHLCNGRTIFFAENSGQPIHGLP